MTEIPVLSESLPDLWTVACELKAELVSEVFSEWDSLYRRLDFLTTQKWIRNIADSVPGWEKIATQKNGLTAKHTLVVLACGLNLPEYKNAGMQTRYEIEWAALFHDIDKEIRFGHDFAHGVRSAMVAAQGLVKLDFAFQANEDFEQWLDLFKPAQKQEDENWVNVFSGLADIMSGLRYFFGEATPASHILKAVMFHQSLPTVEDWPNPIILSKNQIRSSLTLEDMNVLGPLLLADSDAWNICEPTRNAYRDEILGNIEKVRNILVSTG